MPIIKLPAVGKAVQSATVRRWLKKPGDSVAKGDILVELDTEEGPLQVESPVAGSLRQIHLAEGKTGAVHCALGVIAEAADLANTNNDKSKPQAADAAAAAQTARPPVRRPERSSRS